MPTGKHKQTLTDYKEEDSLDELTHIFIFLLVERSGHSLCHDNKFIISIVLLSKNKWKKLNSWIINAERNIID